MTLLLTFVLLNHFLWCLWQDLSDWKEKNKRLDEMCPNCEHLFHWDHCGECDEMAYRHGQMEQCPCDDSEIKLWDDDGRRLEIGPVLPECEHDTIRGQCMWCGMGVETSCIICGKANLSTDEDGGPECQMDDGSWVCGSECWDKVADKSEEDPAFRGWNEYQQSLGFPRKE